MHGSCSPGLLARLVVVWLPLVALGCGTGPRNPTFAISVDEAREALVEMRQEPRPLPRPVLIVGGYMEPGVMPPAVRSTLTPLFDAEDKDDFMTTSLATAGNFDDCRERLIKEVDAHFPSADPKETTEVDVIAISMGGLAARYAADPHAGTRRLRIARLFTIASPHRGSKTAPFPLFSKLTWDMRPGSHFLTSLPSPDYPVIPYTRLGDEIVGSANTAPKGQTPWWVPNRPFQFSHLQAYADPRILADIARRLRDEPTFTHAPPAALPN